MPFEIFDIKDDEQLSENRKPKGRLLLNEVGGGGLLKQDCF